MPCHRAHLPLFPTVLCLVCLAAAGCGNRMSDDQILETSGRMMGVAFPEGTRLLGYYHMEADDRKPGPSSLSDALWLKIEMDAAELEPFLAHSPLAKTTLRTDTRAVFNDQKFSWWDPESPKWFRSGKVEIPVGRYLYVLVDLDRQDKVTVYLAWQET